MVGVKYYILLLSLLSFQFLKAQSKSFYIHKDTIQLAENTGKLFVFEKLFNGLTIISKHAINWKQIKLEIKTDSNGLQPFECIADEHIETHQSNLVTFSATNVFSIQAFEKMELILVFQYVAPLGLHVPLNKKRDANCEQPKGIIPQSIWRMGLDSPKLGKTSSETHHCIIHHSASGNGQSDYTFLVRSYYVQHTQVNGWDDIGYNYLIASDGSIFAGRDPETNQILQDEVTGAHFCGKNTNTMGVCLIGNFVSILPSNAMFSALQDLLVWKFAKDTLNPKGSFAHPFPLGNVLPSLATHRQGCPTTCPGDSVFNRLTQIRNNVYSQYQQCLKQTSVANVQTNPIIIHPNPSHGLFNIKGLGFKKVEVFDVLGQKLLSSTETSFFLPKGIHIAFVYNEKNVFKTIKLIVE